MEVSHMMKIYISEIHCLRLKCASIVIHDKIFHVRNVECSYNISDIYFITCQLTVGSILTAAYFLSYYLFEQMTLEHYTPTFGQPN